MPRWAARAAIAALPGGEIQTGLGEAQWMTHRVIEEHVAWSAEVALVHLASSALIRRVLAISVLHEPIT